jgi:hypothetical protein
VRVPSSHRQKLLAALLLLPLVSTNFAQPASSPSALQVVSAKYGAQGVEKDVTSIVAVKIVDDRLEFTASNSELGGDPAFGKIKELRLKLLVSGQEVEKVFKENDRVSVAALAPSPNTTRAKEPTKPQPTASPVVSASSDPASAREIQIPRVLVVNGQKYEDVTYVSHNDAKLSIKHKWGRANLRLSDLSQELQKKLGFHPDKANAALTEEEKIRAAAFAKADAEAKRQAEEEKRQTLKNNASEMAFDVHQVVTAGLYVTVCKPERKVYGSSYSRVGLESARVIWGWTDGDQNALLVGYNKSVAEGDRIETKAFETSVRDVDINGNKRHLRVYEVAD